LNIKIRLNPTTIITSAKLTHSISPWLLRNTAHSKATKQIRKKIAQVLMFIDEVERGSVLMDEPFAVTGPGTREGRPLICFKSPKIRKPSAIRAAIAHV
jgi:hypothetical protein